MTTQGLDHVARAFDRATSTYAQEARAQRRLAERLASHIVERVPVAATRRICELGCGVGTATAELLRRGLNGEQWWFVDVSGTSIALHEGLYASCLSNAAWYHANAECFQVPLNCGLVVASSAFHWFSDLPRFLARAVVPGRWFAFSVYGAKTLEALSSSYERATGQSFPSPVVYRSSREMTALLAGAGLSVRASERISLEHRCADLRSALIHLRNTGVIPSSTTGSRHVRLSPGMFHQWSREFAALREPDGLCPLRYEGEIWIAKAP